MSKLKITVMFQEDTIWEYDLEPLTNRIMENVPRDQAAYALPVVIANEVDYFMSTPGTLTAVRLMAAILDDISWTVFKSKELDKSDFPILYAMILALCVSMVDTDKAYHELTTEKGGNDGKKADS